MKIESTQKTATTQITVKSFTLQKFSKLQESCYFRVNTIQINEDVVFWICSVIFIIPVILVKITLKLQEFLKITNSIFQMLLAIPCLYTASMCDILLANVSKINTRKDDPQSLNTAPCLLVCVETVIEP